MAKKNYDSNSLYFTDRKEYYRQKAVGSEKSQMSDISSDYEKAIGFAGGGWGRDGVLGRGLTSIGINTHLMDRFPNLAGNGNLYRIDNGYITISDAVWLCQKAWEEFQLFRNTVEAMVEFSLSKIKLSSPNRSAKTFCETWLKAINIDKLAEQFYREMYRSGNIFPYPIKGKIDGKAANNLKIYAASGEIPVKYTIMNPAQVAVFGGLTNDSEIYKVLSPYEIKRLKDPQTEVEKILYNKLDPKIQKQIQNYAGITMNSQIYINLSEINPVFYQKQDYEYFGVPLFYGVLDDIELKLEMKKADKKVLKTLENMILLVTMGGYKVDGNEMPPNPEHLKYMRELFQSQKSQRILVSDYTTKVDYVIPDISNIVGKEKYAQVNEDIREGLQSIFGSNEKFSNQMTKVKVFVQGLKRGQDIFKEWLDGELSNVCKTMGFGAVPSTKMSTINIEDPTQAQRVFTRMAELGFLTPHELNEAIEHGWLPNEEESIESQKKFRKLKDDSLYEPQLNYNPNDEEKGDAPKANGRPAGSGKPLDGPRKQRVVGGIEAISIKEIKSCLEQMDKIEAKFQDQMKKIYKIDKLDDDQIDFAKSIAKSIVKNYPKNKWNTAISKVLKTQKIENNEVMEEEIDKICADFDLEDDFLGALIFHSKKDADSQK
jgi:hypothetical protein